MDDLDNSTNSYSDSIVSNKLQNQLMYQQNEIKRLQQSHSELLANHAQLHTYVNAIHTNQNNMQKSIVHHKNQINATQQQQNHINHKMKDINTLIEDLKVKNQEQAYIRQIPNLQKFYNTFYQALSHCYCQSVVIKSRNVLLDSQNLLIQIGISLIALLPVVGYTLSSSTSLIYQTFEDSELIKKSSVFVNLANSQSDFDIIAEFVSRKITLNQQQDLINETYKVDQKLFDSWIEGFDLMLTNLGVSKFKLPELTVIEHFAHLQANHLATYYISNQNEIQHKYQEQKTSKDRALLLIDILINQQNYTLLDDDKNQNKDKKKGEQTNCSCELPCMIY